MEESGKNLAVGNATIATIQKKGVTIHREVMRDERVCVPVSNIIVFRLVGVAT